MRAHDSEVSPTSGYRGGVSAHSVVDKAQRNFPPLGYPIAVVYKFIDDMGNYLAALLAFYAFVSLFPLLIFGTTILGIVLSGNPGLQQDLITSALSEFPIISDQIRSPSPLSGSWGSITISLLVSLYGALGSAQAFQYIANSVWHVPRNSRPNPFAARGKSAALIALLGTSLLATIGLGTVVPRVVHLAGLAKFGVNLGTLLIDVFALMVAFHVGTSKSLRWRDIWPGALFAAFMWQALQRGGNIYVEHVVQRNKSMNGDLSVVLGLMLLLFLAGMVMVLSMEINAVWVLRLWPRALLTPFTDRVQLTEADKRAYAGLARAARLKGFQQIDVGFEKPPRDRAEADEMKHQPVQLPLDFGGGDDEAATTEADVIPPPPDEPDHDQPAPEPEATASEEEPSPATKPLPAHTAQHQQEPHRLPSGRPGQSTSTDDERTIPLVRRREDAGDEEDGSVIRGPWSADG